jgi:hypothetical protein
MVHRFTRGDRRLELARDLRPIVRMHCH